MNIGRIVGEIEARPMRQPDIVELEAPPDSERTDAEAAADATRTA
jgi:hypothetical protein